MVAADNIDHTAFVGQVGGLFSGRWCQVDSRFSSSDAMPHHQYMFLCTARYPCTYAPIPKSHWAAFCFPRAVLKQGPKIDPRKTRPKSTRLHVVAAVYRDKGAMHLVACTTNPLSRPVIWLERGLSWIRIWNYEA